MLVYKPLRRKFDGYNYHNKVCCAVEDGEGLFMGFLSWNIPTNEEGERNMEEVKRLAKKEMKEKGYKMQGQFFGFCEWK